MVSRNGLIALTAVLTALVIISVSLRLWAHCTSRMSIWADDICSVIAAVGYTLEVTLAEDSTEAVPFHHRFHSTCTDL